MTTSQLSGERIVDAYQYPRRIQPGCMHQLACRCDPPYWLRDPSPAELARWHKTQDSGDEA